MSHSRVTGRRNDLLKNKREGKKKKRDIFQNHFFLFVLQKISKMPSLLPFPEVLKLVEVYGQLMFPHPTPPDSLVFIPKDYKPERVAELHRAGFHRDWIHVEWEIGAK